MARSKSFFGLRRGSTKSMTFQVLNGQQITKDRVSEVRNPKTEKQVYQRMVFATVSQATKLLKPIINHSFENKAYGEESVQHFRSINMKKLRSLAAIDYESDAVAPNFNAYVTKTGTSQLIPNSYIIADGSLVKPTVYVQRTSTILQLALPQVTFGFSGTESGGAKYVTLGLLFANILGLRDNNEQLSLVTINRANESGDDPDLYVYEFEGDAPGAAIAYTSFSAMRVFIDSTVNLNQHVVLTNGDGELLDSPEVIIANALTNALAVSSETDEKFNNLLKTLLTGSGLELSDGVLTFADTSQNLDPFFENAEGAGHVYAAGLVRSRLDGTKWLRSRADMMLATPTTTNNFGLNIFTAYNAIMEEEYLGSSNYFLNGGGVADQIGESFT